MLQQTIQKICSSSHSGWTGYQAGLFTTSRPQVHLQMPDTITRVEADYFSLKISVTNKIVW